MKKYILAAFIALAFAPAVRAQYTVDDIITDPKYHTTLEFPKDNGVQLPAGKDFGYSKNISKPFSNGYYYIKLESFATGAGDIVEKPADIVLVLDVSGSMRENYGTESGWFPLARNNGGGWVYSDSYADTYYKVGENQYEPVYHLRTGTSNANYRYFLYYDHGGTRYWLWQDGVQTTQPAGATAQGAQAGGYIYWGVLWRNKHKAKIDELKDAVKDFIAVIQENDQYFVDENGQKTLRTDDNGNPRPLGNKISLVKFAYQRYFDETNLLLEGNHRGANGNNNYNYSELVKNLTTVDNAGVTALEAAIDGFIEAGTTASDYGLNIANAVLGNIPGNRDSNRTVVLFTDGTPTRNSNFEQDVANNAINFANTAKTTYKAKVFTVGVFDNETNNIRTYMNRVSSNYTGATSMTNTGAKQVDTKYYMNASSGNMREVFANIAKQAGGSGSALNGATSNVDVVSNSFVLPEGTNAQNIGDKVKVFTAPLTEIDDAGNYIFGTETLAGHATDTYQVFNEDGEVIGTYKVDEVPNPAGGTPATLPIKVELQGTHGIKVTNFDYGNNWCGPIKNQAHEVVGYHGHKIMIFIPIQMDPNAVGGPNVETNEEGSGIYNNNQPYVTFISPKVSLPVNIHIEKKGLKKNESARFLIERAVIPDSGKIEDIATNAWEYVTTVFVTNSPDHAKFTEENNPVIRVRGLAANKSEEEGYIYRVTEENWSWSYTGTTPAQYTDTQHITNPFTFENTPITSPTDVRSTIKHAESKVKNKFNSSTGTKEYDDSKTNTD